MIADLLLDLEDDESLVLNLTMIKNYKTLCDYRNILHPVMIDIHYLESDKYSLVKYPYLEIGCLGISVLKSWVEATFKIPCKEQTMIYDNDEIIENEFFPKYLSNHRKGDLKVKLLVYSTADEDLNSLYRRLEIKTILPVDVSSFGTSNVWRFDYRRGGEKLDGFIENSLQIPKHKQRLFINGHRISSNDIEKALFSERDLEKYGVIQNFPFYEGDGDFTEILSSLPVKPVVQVDDIETELLERVQRLGLSRIRSVIIKHPDPENSTIFYDCPLSRLESTERKLHELLAEEHEGISPRYLCLLHNQQSIMYVENIEDLFIEKDRVHENLFLTLAINKNTDEDMQKFCEKYNLTPYKKVNIKFLTGEFSVDVLSGVKITLRDIKDEIFKTKGIPHLKQLYHENVELSDDDDKLTFTNQLMTQNCITLNLLVKPAQKFKLYINANFLKEQMEIEILETSTILDLKKEISARSGIPSKIIVISRYDEGDSEPLWNCSFHQFQYYVVDVWKKVIVHINNEGTVMRRDHNIQDLETETLAELHNSISLSYHGYCHSDVSLKNTGLKPEALLKDLGETELTFVVNTRNRCSIM